MIHAMDASQLEISYDCPNIEGSQVNYYPTSTSLPLLQGFQDDPSPLSTLYEMSPLSPTSSNGSSLHFSQPECPFDATASPLPVDLSLSPATLSLQSLQPFQLQEDETEVIVSISTAFHPNQEPVPDTVVVSSDHVLFYVNSKTIIDKCPVAFQSILSASISDEKFRETHIQLDAHSTELNIILHGLYKTSPAVHSPDLQTLVRAIDHMPTYSIPPDVVVVQSSPLHDLVLSYAPLHPLEIYALAAHHRLHAMAVSASAHLLSFNLGSISDEMAERIGATYLKKLFLLHVGRFASLKMILLHPPSPHPPNKHCGFENQKSLTRAWALVTAYLAWDARPDLSTYSMHAALDPLMQHLHCQMCLQALEDRIKDVIVQWTSIKVSQSLKR